MTVLTRFVAMLLIGLWTHPMAATAADIRSEQWHLDFLHVDEAHAITDGRGVVVAVIDTGVDAGHADLTGTIMPGIDLVGRDGGDGHLDLDGHGTAMAGLIAAHGQATGIAPGAAILPVRFMITNGLPSSYAAAAVDWAVEHGAKVLCLAFGQVDDMLLQQALERAADRDVVAIAAIGNLPDRTNLYPGLYPSVVAAAGTDRLGNHAAISLAGEEALLAAPAVDIVSTVPKAVLTSGYVKSDGTSNSAAIIAGVAALIRSKYPNLSASEVIHRMTATADDKGPPGRDNEYGYGIVNPVKALTADVPPLSPTDQPTNATSPPPDTISQTGTLLIVGGVILALLLGTGLALALRRRP